MKTWTLSGSDLSATQQAEDYGAGRATQRISVFKSIGTLIENDRGFGFRVRRTDTDARILAQWGDVLGWWLNEPEVPGPGADQLRAWQRFVADNLEFRMGVAIGAVVAQAWADGASDPLAVPSLADWKATTGLPWFGFWARELLRWGAHDPFVAFCLSQGLASTREDAGARRPSFDEWLRDELDNPEPDDWIDPQLFLRWQESLPHAVREDTTVSPLTAVLTGTDGRHGRYSVVPVAQLNHLAWLDPAGFELAITSPARTIGSHLVRSDYELDTTGKVATVARRFRPA